MLGRKWRLDYKKAERVKGFLLEKGGEEKKVQPPYELWRVRLADATFTYYKSKTLYSTRSWQDNPDVLVAYDFINQIAGSLFIGSKKEFLIGLDETGKGEVIGYIHLVGTFIPSSLFPFIEEIVNSVESKKYHSFDYWEKIFKKIYSFKRAGLNFIEKKIAPKAIDKYNINRLMDIGYQQILQSLLKDSAVEKCRIVIDDYGVGEKFKSWLSSLVKKGAEVKVQKDADASYLEVKVASIIAKFKKEEVFKRIREDKEFQVEGTDIGTGNLNDKKTLQWLRNWYSLKKEWPWFIRKSFSVVREIEGKKSSIKKKIPFSSVTNQFNKTN